MKKLMIAALVVICVSFPLVTACGPAAPAPPTSTADFYKNNSVTIYQGYSPGGGPDFAIRMFASYWPKVTGGTMVADIKEGGSGLVLSNWIYKTAKPDGLTIALNYTGASLIGPVLLKASGVEFDLQKFNYIGSFYLDMPGLAISTKLPYTSLEELRKVKGLKIGTVSKRGVNALAAALAIKLLGLQDAKIVPGYTQTPELLLAAGRGEIDALAYTSGTLLRESTKGYFKPVWVSLADKRTAAYPDAPALSEIVQISAEDKPLVSVLTALSSYPLFFTSPGVPQDKVQFLRDAFDKIYADNTFVTLMKPVFPVWTPPVKGPEVAKNIESALKVSQADIDKGNALIDQYAR